MGKYDILYKPYGEQAIIVEWPSFIDKSILDDVLIFKNKIIDFYSDEKIQITHAYQSIVIYYNHGNFDYNKEIKALKEVYTEGIDAIESSSRIWNIPVCYDEQFGIDLQELSNLKNLTKKEIIKLHSAAVYPVYFIGFLPGFLYLGGLNDLLHTPRRQTPRLKVEKGSVAIGGKQTGIYPNESPGGWHIIGNSPINFFETSNMPPCFAKAGDYIKFTSITVDRYRDIRTLVEAGVYQIENEMADD